MNRAFVEIDITTDLYALKTKCGKYKDKNKLADICYKSISKLGKELEAYAKEEIKKQNKKLTKKN